MSHPVDVPTRPLGDPPVTELNTKPHDAQTRAKARASTLIQRYAGAHWQAAQRAKWIVDIVMHIDRDYREFIMEQAAQIQQQQQQISDMQNAHTSTVNHGQAEVRALEDLARQQQAQLRDSAATVLDLQARLAHTEAALAVADQAASDAARDMALLHQSVTALTEHDARACKRLANRAHEVKEALRKSQASVRHNTEAARRHSFEVAAMLRLKDEALARDTCNLKNTYMSQIAAVHQVERAAARLEVTKMGMELEAYKEPWMYQFGKKAPTTNKNLAAALGMPQPMSLKTCAPV